MPPHTLAARVRGVRRGTAATIAARGFDVVVTYAFYALVARSISVAGFGRLVVGIAVLQAVAALARFGLDQALLAVAPSGALNRFAARIVAAISVVLALAGALLFQDRFELWLAAALPAVALAQFTVGALRARGDVITAATAEGIVQPAAALAFGAIAYLAPSPAAYALAYALSWVATLPFALRLDWKGQRLDSEASSHLLRTARAMLGSLIFQQASASADVLLLGAIATAADVGRYAAAQKIAAAFLLLHGAITSAVTPYMRPLAGEPGLLLHYYRVVTRWSAIAAVPLFAVAVGAPGLVLRLFGREYVDGSRLPLVILSVAGVVMLLSGPAGSVLLCSGRAHELLRITALGTIALVAAVAAFAHFGAAGAAAGVLAGRLIGRGLLVAAVRRPTRS